MAGGGVAVRLGQVLDPVVPTIAIEVAQRGRGPRAMYHEPRDIMGTKVVVTNTNLIDSRGALAQMNLASTVQVGFPMHFARFRAITKRMVDQGKIVSAHVVPFSTMVGSKAQVVQHLGFAHFRMKKMAVA